MDNSDRYVFHKKNKGDKIWWVSDMETYGYLLISFDGKKMYNLWRDYPHAFSKEQKELFDKENPFWANFFKGR